MWTTIKKLLSSRKFMAALTTVVVDVVIALSMDPAMAVKLMSMITTLGGLFIAGTALEDYASKRNDK